MLFFPSSCIQLMLVPWTSNSGVLMEACQVFLSESLPPPSMHSVICPLLHNRRCCKTTNSGPPSPDNQLNFFIFLCLHGTCHFSFVVVLQTPLYSATALLNWSSPLLFGYNSPVSHRGNHTVTMQYTICYTIHSKVTAFCPTLIPHLNTPYSNTSP